MKIGELAQRGQLGLIRWNWWDEMARRAHSASTDELTLDSGLRSRVQTVVSEIGGAIYEDR